ncbi:MULTISPECIES: oxygen-dependent coproporphyrinogen oxidase [unclassified Aureispira]|uniref:oxygen-dependent coproporphyrinogen oxidase n=1 Tax=unclassified Aureispira TaxID=2649989 RepID=UPI000697C4C2|nr:MULTISPECIES: oxygen-dependent coproporphyrinogen oxidase [unclassified Aureispira]WMX13805.1 oxygen-dependent coproporphyrinogen oxidase [Aureispira sp. CCB-E]
MPNKEEITNWFQGLQDSICQGLETLDGKGQFKQDLWERPEGGGGRTRVLSEGAVIEKGGVNFSAVEGNMPAQLLKVLKVDANTSEPITFYATGVSIVLHPRSPRTPIIHMNVRYFEMSDGTWWFGGGIDLTPHYVDEKLAGAFHQQLKTVCDAHDASYYPAFKQWADDYFFIKHREETRGIGGIFFDRLKATDEHTKADRWAFVQAVGAAFVDLYSHQVQATRNLSYGQNELDWQRLRRGRYVEFNLVWDRGTKFGLETNGRTESILMSLPPQADWAYSYEPTPNSPEAQTLNLLKKDINWVDKLLETAH